MNAKIIVDRLLNLGPLDLTEASVHLPKRGRKWVAVFTGGEPGKQVWRSTGLTDRDAALALARKWEVEARKKRLALGKGPQRAAVRARRSPRGSDKFQPLTQGEVAVLLNMSERAVRNVEKRALAKLRKHPAIRELLDQIKSQTSESMVVPLTAEELAALFALADTDEERLILKRVLMLMSRFGSG